MGGTEYVILRIHYAGYFFWERSRLTYLNGYIEEIEVDKDRFNYYTVLKYAKELGSEKVVKIFWRMPKKPLSVGCILFEDDSLSVQILRVAKNGDELDFYIEYEVETAVEILLLPSTEQGHVEDRAEVERDEVGRADEVEREEVGRDDDDDDDDVINMYDEGDDEGEMAFQEMDGDDDNGDDEERIVAMEKVKKFYNMERERTKIGHNGDDDADVCEEIPVGDDNENETVSENEENDAMGDDGITENEENVGEDEENVGENEDNQALGDDADHVDVRRVDQVNEEVRIPSPYHPDDDPGIYKEADECHDPEVEDDALRIPSVRPKFDAEADLPSFCLGMVFDNSQQFKEAIEIYAIGRGVNLGYVKNEPKRVSVKCSYKGCPWRIWASVDNTENVFMIKSYESRHECTRQFTNKRCSTKFVTKYFRRRIISQPTLKPIEMMRLCREELKLKVNLAMCKRAKRVVLDEIEGSFKEEFNHLEDYAAELRLSNVGSTVEVKSVRHEDGKLHFVRFYVCFAACKKGWLAGCRPIIGMDGCFLKGICKGQLLAAVGRDGNNQMFPIAWAVVSVENKFNWKWFIQRLQADLGFDIGQQLTFMTDMQKGLSYAISDICADVEHRMCARHIYAAFRKKWRTHDLKKQFWICAKTTYEEELDDQFKELNRLGKGSVEDLMEYPVQTWCRAYFSSRSCCDIVDNNLSETFNGWILEARQKAIISMLEDIRKLVMCRLVDKRKSTDAWICDIAPRALKVLEANKLRACKCYVDFNGESGFEVIDGNNRHCVDVEQKTCTCRAWQLSGIPCPHACAALFHVTKNPDTFMSHWYTKETYLKAYAFCMGTVRGQKFWPKTNQGPMEPPEFRIMPGRPKLCRRKDPYDETKLTGKLSRKGRIMTCGNCGKGGHNKKGCKQPPKQATSGGQNSRTEQKRKNADASGIEMPTRQAKKKGRPQCSQSTIPSVHMSQQRTVRQASSAPGQTHLSFKPKGLRFKGNPSVTSSQLQAERDAMVNKRVGRQKSSSTIPTQSSQNAS